LKPAIGIASGDPAGIGPEIAVKAALDPRVLEICRPVLVGDRAVFEMHGSLGTTELLQVDQAKPQLGKIRPEHGKAALAAAEAAIRAAMAGRFEAVVAAPHTEAAIHAAGIEFDGYPSFVARVAGMAPEDGILMLCFEHGGREVRIPHVTLHMGIGEALRRITKARILRTLKAADEALKRMGIEKPKIAVGGVNPHAGEQGAFGREEIEIVEPALGEARAAGLDVTGPIGADTLLQREGFDAYAVMFHDQGHVAAKCLAPQRVAGLTIGTPVLFSSVAHGSALDIAGQGRAQHGAMVEAITRLVGRRRRAAAT
jgi:4-hydroxy-L-threonine phosphate dehydrogenase PdxA